MENTFVGTVKKWGNSLALVVPANLAKSLSLEDGMEIIATLRSNLEGLSVPNIFINAKISQSYNYFRPQLSINFEIDNRSPTHRLFLDGLVYRITLRPGGHHYDVGTFYYFKRATIGINSKHTIQASFNFDWNVVEVIAYRLNESNLRRLDIEIQIDAYFDGEPIRFEKHEQKTTLISRGEWEDWVETWKGNKEEISKLKKKG